MSEREEQDNMSEKSKTLVLVLTRDGREVTKFGAHRILGALHLPPDTGIGFGSFLNDPHFLAGAIVQARASAKIYVAVIDAVHGKLNALHSDRDLRLFVQLLMTDESGRTSFEIFMEHF